MKNCPLVSVIIPVYNDTERLIKCLEAIKRQNYSGKYEVIIIDNGSDETLQPVKGLFPEYHFYNEEKPGSYTARNKGIVLSKGDILAFTDSDCIPSEDWIQNGVRKMENADRCVVGGKIEFIFKNQQQPNLYELFDSMFNLAQEKNIKTSNFSLTANLFVSRNTFDEVGMFNSKMMSCGDHEWGIRCHSKDYSIIYAPEVVIHHPARNSFMQLYKRCIRIAGGRYYLGFYQNRPPIKQILTTIVPPIRKIINIFRNTKISVYEKTIMSLLHLLFRYRSILEKLRLMLIGKAKRV